jgi:hypothetical protein
MNIQPIRQATMQCDHSSVTTSSVPCQLWRLRVPKRPSSIRHWPGLRAKGLVEWHYEVPEGKDRGLATVGEAKLGQDAVCAAGTVYAEPRGYAFETQGTQHVIYLDDNGHVVELYWTP